MKHEVNTDVASMGVRVVHDAYSAWFNAESESGRALRAWRRSSGPARELAYDVYRAALDREESAALDLERLWSLANPCGRCITVG
jgi:hypothetical protein